MTTDLMLVSSYRITDQVINDLDHSIFEFRSAVERSKAKKMVILAVATSVGYAVRGRKNLALGSMLTGAATIAASAFPDVKRVDKLRKEVQRILHSACVDTNDQMLMMQLALIDLDLLLTRGYTRPTTNGKFTVVDGNTISLCVFPESKGIV